MLLDEDFDWVIQALGHDGSRIINSEPEPFNRLGFTVDEILIAGLRLGYPLFQTSVLQIDEEDKPPRELLSQEEKRTLLDHDSLLLFGIVNDQPHAVYCKNQVVYDPNGTVYSVKEFQIFSVIERLNTWTNRLSALCRWQKDVR